MDPSQIFSSPLSTELNPNDVQIIDNGNPGGNSYWNPATQIEVGDNGCVFVAYRQFDSGATADVTLASRSPFDPEWSIYPVDQEIMIGQSSLPSALAVSRGFEVCGTPTVALSSELFKQLSVATLVDTSDWVFSDVPQISAVTPVALASGSSGELPSAGLFLCVPDISVKLYFMAVGKQEWTLIAEIETLPPVTVSLAVYGRYVFVSYMNGRELNLVQINTAKYVDDNEGNAGFEQVELLREEMDLYFSPSTAPLLAADQYGVVVGAVSQGSSIHLWEIDLMFEGRDTYSFLPILSQVSPIDASLNISETEVIVSIINSANRNDPRSESFGFVVAKHNRAFRVNSQSKWDLHPVDLPGFHASISSALQPGTNELWVSLMETGFNQLAELIVVNLTV